MKKKFRIVPKTINVIFLPDRSIFQNFETSTLVEQKILHKKISFNSYKYEFIIHESFVENGPKNPQSFLVIPKAFFTSSKH
jgi:hypothetical protein